MKDWGYIWLLIQKIYNAIGAEILQILDEFRVTFIWGQNVFEVFWWNFGSN